MPSKYPKPGQSLADLRPDLAKQWHPTENVDENGRILTPFDFKVYSAYKARWLCENGVLCSHDWDSVISDRTYNGADCPFCCGKRLV